jgi:DNA-binding MarR family transcriptional regulator
MVAQSELRDKDLALWVTLLAEVLNAETLATLRVEHPDVRYAHGFLFQQLVEGARPVGEIASNLGVTSQAVSKMVRELEALGYVERVVDAEDARVRRVALTERGRAAIQAGRDVRARVNRELSEALGAERVEDAAKTLHDALAARGAMSAVRSRRLRSAQDLSGPSR